MDRQTALQQMDSEFLPKLREKADQNFQKSLKENKAKIKEMLFQALHEMDKTLQAGIIQFQIYRMDILQENYEIVLNGFDKFWYVGSSTPQIRIDVRFLFEPYQQLKENMLSYINSYYPFLNFYDIQNRVFQYINDAYQKMAFQMREYFWLFEENPLSKELNVFDEYVIRWGEHRGATEIIYAMDTRKKTTEDLREFQKKSEQDESFIYSVWYESELENVDLSKENLLFANFSKSSLRKMKFGEAKLVSTQLKEISMKKCDFDGSGIYGVNIEKANLYRSHFIKSNFINVSFKESRLKKLIFDESTLERANFEDTDMEDCSFENCQFKETSFLHAKMKNISFTGADLSGCIFDAKAVPYLNLSDQQIQEIYIYSEDKQQCV